jgi:hypothetical protein
MSQKKASIGRLVHFTLPDGQCRPAIVIRLWGPDQGYPQGPVNLQVFIDGSNDNRQHEGQFLVPEAASGVAAIWRTSVHEADGPEPGCWHWPERV